MTTRPQGRKIHTMKLSAVAAALLSCVLAGTTVLSAQLGDVARKEAERRKTTPSSGKTYTNDNIKPEPLPSAAPVSSGSTSSEASPATPPASSSSSPATDKAATDKAATDKAAIDKGATDKAAADKAATDKDKAAPPPQVSADPAERKKDEAQWRDKIKNAREALERAQSFADALQSKINALNTDFVNRDDPQQRAKVAADRDKALAELGTAKKEIEQHTKAIAKIQEDARRAGAPAGWVR